MVTENELLSALDQIVADKRDAHENHVLKEEWHDALVAVVEATIWRTIAFAIRSDLIPAGFDPRADPLSLANGLREICLSQQAEIDRDASQRIEEPRDVVVDVLTSVIALTSALSGASVNSRDNTALIALTAGGLGHSDVLLGFAEEGFWEQIAGWRKSRGGRRVGYRAPWKVELAESIQKIIEQNSGASQLGIAQMVIEQTPSLTGRPSDADSMVKALRAMAKDGLIRW